MALQFKGHMCLPVDLLLLCTTPKVAEEAERRRGSVCSAGLLCALCSTLCIVGLTGSPGADRVTCSCCLDACSNDRGRWGMDGGKWNGIVCKQTYAICKTGLGQA